MRPTIISRWESSVVWNESDAEGSKSFLGYLQVSSNKMTGTVESTAIVVNTVHVVLMNVKAKHRRWLIENDHTVVCFLPVRVGMT